MNHSMQNKPIITETQARYIKKKDARVTLALNKDIKKRCKI